MGLPVVGALLGHKEAATTEHNAHLDASPLRVASDRIADHIAITLSQPNNRSGLSARWRAAVRSDHVKLQHCYGRSHENGNGENAGQTCR